MPNRMAALPNIGSALCSTPQSLADAHYYSAVQERCQDAKPVCPMLYVIAMGADKNVVMQVYSILYTYRPTHVGLISCTVARLQPYIDIC